MKLCPNCGKELEDHMKFCSGCGTKCERLEEIAVADPRTEIVDTQPDIPVYEAKLVRKPRRKKAVAILCLLLVLVVIGAVGFFALKWYFSPEQQLLRALEKGDFDAALEIVEEDSSLKKNEELTAKLQERITAVQTNYSAGILDYAAALSELDAVEEMNFKSLESSLAQTRDFVENLNSSRTAFATAESFFQAGDYIEAITQYKRVIAEDSNYETAKEHSAEAVDLYRTQVLADAAAYADTGAYDNAITVLNAGLGDLPGDAQLTQQIQLYQKAKADQILSSALAEAAVYAEAGDYNSAITVLEQYARQHGDNVDVGVALNNYRNSLAEKVLATALDTAAAYAQIGDYVSAIRTLNTYTSDYGTNASVVLAVNGYTESYVESVLTDAEASAVDGDYVSAIQTLRAAQSNVSADRLTTRLNTYTADYETQIITQSDALLASEDYDGAQAVVDQGLVTLPNSTALREQSGKIEDARPKNFVEVCTPYEKSYYTVYKGGATFRMAGMEYGNGFTLALPSGYAYFNLDGLYTMLEFELGHVDGTAMNNQTVNVYLDGVLFKSYSVPANGLPQHISIPIEGVKQLRIASNVTGPKAGFGNVIIK